MRLALPILLFGSVWVSAAQQDFEVASVRQREGPFQRMYDVSTSGPRFTCGACAVPELILYAYNLKRYELAFANPSPELETRYDIVAKAAGDTPRTREEFRQMVQRLLAERFGLASHREAKEMPVYALTAGKSGPKIKESPPDSPHQWSLGVVGRNYKVTMRKVAMEEICSAIGNAFLDRPIVDQTGLTGFYDATLAYTPQTRAIREGEPDLNDMSIFIAVQEQLGLKLEPTKATIQVLVVDRVAKPSAN